MDGIDDIIEHISLDWWVAGQTRNLPRRWNSPADRFRVNPRGNDDSSSLIVSRFVYDDVCFDFILGLIGGEISWWFPVSFNCTSVDSAVVIWSSLLIISVDNSKDGTEKQDRFLTRILVGEQRLDSWLIFLQTMISWTYLSNSISFAFLHEKKIFIDDASI